MDDDEDSYVPPWAQTRLEVFNRHLPQLKPRRDQRPAALDEAVERANEAPEKRPSGHSLIR